jgi:superfamily I DNA and/or RNA helicase
MVEDINVLKEQYRMHEQIKAFSNQMFYEGQIESNDQNKNWKLQYHNFNQMHHQLKTVLDPEKPFVFYDTKKRNNERQKNDSKSYYNPVEAKYISTLIQQLKKLSIDDHQIGVITPYRAQVKHLRKKIGHQNNIEIDTVDSFQGREKDLIIFSLVRSNPDNRIGFLKDMRRLNVSLTRAKKKLIVVGDRKTIEQHDLYKTMVKTYQIS